MRADRCVKSAVRSLAHRTPCLMRHVAFLSPSPPRVEFDLPVVIIRVLWITYQMKMDKE